MSSPKINIVTVVVDSNYSDGISVDISNSIAYFLISYNLLVFLIVCCDYVSMCNNQHIRTTFQRIKFHK